jgi:RluA family pseudouridine synthase
VVSSGSASSERRSPLALEHDPPVERFDWLVDSPLAGDELLAATVERAGWTTEDAERLGRHAGIHLDGHRLLPESPPRLVPEGTRVVAYRLSAEPRPVSLPEDAVLFDRDGLVAVAKPAFFTVQGTRATRMSSLERALRERLDCPRLTPIHRLDRETSGLVLFARERSAASDLGRQFQRRSIEKEYLAVVAPPPAEEDWTVEGLLVRVEHPSHSRFGLSDDGGAEGKPSRTRFELEERSDGRALVRAHPETGRTHQLRVHLTASGCPIVGDSLYGAGWQPGVAESAERLQLHALRLRFRLGGEPLELEAAPPPDFGLST